MTKKFCDNCGKEIIKNYFTNSIGNGKLKIEVLSYLQENFDAKHRTFREFDLCKECCKKYLDELDK